MKTTLLAGIGAPALGLFAPNIARGQGAVTLKFAHPDSNLHPNHKMAEAFAGRVGERTNGAVKIDIFAGGQLGSSVSIATGVATGTVDLVYHTAGFLSSIFPMMQVLDLPFLFRDARSGERVTDGEIGQMIFASLAPKNVYGLAWSTNGWRVVETTRKVVRAPDDLSGMKFRIQQSPVFVAMAKAFNAQPVSLDVSEMYLALTQNTIDGYEFPLLSVVATKLHEVTKFVSETNHTYNAMALLGSKFKLDKLDPTHLKVLREEALRFGNDTRKSIVEASAAAKKTCQDAGIQFNPVDYAPFRQKVEPVFAQFRTSMGEQLIDKLLKAAEG
ncbi:MULTISPECIES: TRAP transporter substrate-binding protein [Bradyrhizobium]|uniref:TRAP transporter substrate-binding protein n=1 Tax=Bradyrhizobium zhengyangense TaxID=2911009 RepID=A0A9X1UBY4_9BRAD|nr:MULTISPECIES: TRAP transporter substrate-binding protein [Bradyrhizobium]MCG2629473.1 TRAP transporter substrate-binding protein [Bradyrhizobium zhengyangense]MDN4984622.1 TRAP transporter substrate-binding protein [Bradyrhizobium sp. WYCCWR 13022]MCG2644899.1 TRAP transporter substrate-binding protein [Bradyrhizobium zhengyangense]MCG2670987.1 TRAP transporter substrate-binding protein [Bradyrhizobium zhengyangense]MDT4737042.1 TRAP transporter substrate-binding protein [Bradyrhizobium sp.